MAPRKTALLVVLKSGTDIRVFTRPVRFNYERIGEYAKCLAGFVKTALTGEFVCLAPPSPPATHQLAALYNPPDTTRHNFCCFADDAVRPLVFRLS